MNNVSVKKAEELQIGDIIRAAFIVRYDSRGCKTVFHEDMVVLYSCLNENDEKSVLMKLHGMGEGKETLDIACNKNIEFVVER